MKKTGRSLDLDQWESSAQALDELLSDAQLRAVLYDTFYTHEVSNGYALYTGAFIGTLLNRHAQFNWVKDPAPPMNTPWSMVNATGSAQSTIFPFGKVQKQYKSESPGDLAAWVKVLVNKF